MKLPVFFSEDLTVTQNYEIVNHIDFTDNVRVFQNFNIIVGLFIGA